ncbi:hypothetical protein BAUCODRAFT_305787 [Lecanosticta acicola]|uniref:SET domain-containing protein n=1 Tax=Lecanosticta acicola TaxID=111012 RepID=A0AAI9EBW9_9PEZI|nr:hypothetical protein BAUCODRAFT_305787 [Lecanosticta acicola]
MAPDANSLASHLQQSLSIPDDEASSHNSRESSTAEIGSSLSPLANDFRPTFGPAPPPFIVATSFYEKREIHNKGTGLVALRDIPVGTRIICEPPLLTIPYNLTTLVWDQYCQLSLEDKHVYDNLSYHPHLNAHLRQPGQISSSSENSKIDGDADEEGDAIRVTQIFASNNLVIAKGAHGVFRETSRINHSCVPNVHHSFSPDLKKEVVHAARDICAGEELLTTYMGQAGIFSTRAQRTEYLRTNYGFTCQCPACTDITGVSDAHRMLLNSLVYGIEQFRKGSDGVCDTKPKSLSEARSQAIDIIGTLLTDGLSGTELVRAYRLASELAVDDKDFEQALEFAVKELEVECNLMGMERDDLKRKGLASEQWIAEIQEKQREMMLQERKKLKHAKKNQNRKGEGQEKRKHMKTGGFKSNE